MKLKIAVFILTFQVVAIENTIGQNEMFGIGGIVGVNFSLLAFEEPINNEQQLHNTGLNAGIFCNADINNHFNLRIELLYSTNGSYILPDTFPKIEYGKIKLNHLEVPFHFDFYINSFEFTDFLPDWTLELGGAYTKLFHYHIEDINGNDISNQIVYNYKDALLLQVGTTVYFTKHFGAHLRYSLPLLPSKGKISCTNTIRLIYRL